MSNAKKKSAKEKRVLFGALVVAGVITAGSTFAWFTSKDEVTNRLTASANYGVSVVEDFTPPEDWTPGQKINKDVSAVNTGNVDAYVRMAIQNDLQLNVAGAGAAVDSDAIVLPTTTESFVELQRTAVDAQDANGTSNAVDKVPNSVSTLQAGGTLVLEAGVPKQPTDAQNVGAGDDVSDDADDYDGADQYLPTKSGLYLFKRTVAGTPTYSGYFYVAKSGADAGGEGTYYALQTAPGTVNMTGTVTETDGIVTAVSGVKLATTKDVTVKNTETGITAKWYKSDMNAATAVETTAGAADAKWIQLSYTAVDGNPILLDIELAEGWSSKWTFVATNTQSPSIDQSNDFGYFYYNNILPAGNTTPKLIDSVTLDNTVTQDAYNEMVYDLTVVLESIQVTKSEDQKTYTDESAKTWISNATVTAGTGAVTWKAN